MYKRLVAAVKAHQRPAQNLGRTGLERLQSKLLAAHMSCFELSCVYSSYRTTRTGISDALSKQLAATFVTSASSYPLQALPMLLRNHNLFLELAGILLTSTLKLGFA
jgi:hypothetical protein